MATYNNNPPMGLANAFWDANGTFMAALTSSTVGIPLVKEWEALGQQPWVLESDFRVRK